MALEMVSSSRTLLCGHLALQPPAPQPSRPAKPKEYLEVVLTWPGLKDAVHFVSQPRSLVSKTPLC